MAGNAIQTVKSNDAKKVHYRAATSTFAAAETAPAQRYKCRVGSRSWSFQFLSASGIGRWPRANRPGADICQDHRLGRRAIRAFENFGQIYEPLCRPARRLRRRLARRGRCRICGRTTGGFGQTGKGWRRNL